MLKVRGCVLIFFLAGLFLIGSQVTYGQEKCGTVQYEKMLHKKSLETETQFEQWIQNKINERRLRAFSVESIQSTTFVIPVVVHVIHNGVNDLTNISDAQIASQIQVLNDDYKRLNADRNSTPSEFLPVAGNIDIQFVLARQDPEGLATNGITRTLGSKTTWTINDNSELKALSYWPAENYLNLWVVNLSGGLIGYAQLPISPPSNPLPGLETASPDRLTDGVVIYYRAFGTSDAGGFNLDAQFNKGRTATHEIGHFFGLRHIWGDGSSCNTDYVDDTPPQSAYTNGCPANPQTSCGGHKMFQNYLDYTNDVCMNIFTMGQVDRMTIIIQNSPRRASLLTSPGASDPVPVANDLGIKQIVNPISTPCNIPLIPQIEVRNYGNNNINSAQITLTVDGVQLENKTFSSLNLAPLQTQLLSFNTLSFAPASSHFVTFQIIQTNGTTDGLSGNNLSSVQSTVPQTITLPINEPFNNLPAGWQIVNPDNGITWANVAAPDGSPSNRAMSVNFSTYESVGNLDRLVTPSFTLSHPSTSQVRFDMAYALYPGEYQDELKIYALPGCNSDLSQAILIYDKSGSALSTASNTYNPFVPSTASQWRKPEVKALNMLSAGSSWQLAFVAKNGWGNNLYIDNVIITDFTVNDVALTRIVSPGIVECESSPVIQFNLANFGTSATTSFQAKRTLNGGATVAQDFNNISIDVGEEKTFSLPSIPFHSGENTIILTIDNPNGFADSLPSNNTITFNSILDTSTDTSPLRQNFDDPTQTPWVIASPAVNALVWESVGTNKNQSIAYKAYSNATISEESWVVSPVLDLTRYGKNTLFFDVGYAQKVPVDDRLKVLASTDCGLTYPIILFDQAGSEFSVANSNADWVPVSNSDWKRLHINLDTISGINNVRLAFVATNGHGNNIYIDNVEVFAGDDTNPPTTSGHYQLYYSNANVKSDIAMTFNLPEKKDVRLQIYSLMGSLVADNILPDTLNQTYYFDLSIQAAGLYLFRVLIGNDVSTTKVYIAH